MATSNWIRCLVSPAAVLIAALALSACTSDEVKDFLHVSGKVAYDTMKNVHKSDGKFD